MDWIQVLFGWPGILSALILVAAGLFARNVLVAIIGALLSLPFSFYLAATPDLRFIGLVPFLALALSTFALARKRRARAWGLFAIAALFTASVAFLLYF